MRPRFHFAPASGWINDPHAIALHEGVWHVFFQHVPEATAWSAACSWGHAVGPDLQSLTELAPALTLGDGDDGIWTGCLVPTEPARIFYTAADLSHMDIGRVRVATAVDDGWAGWIKGPVVVEPPEGVELTTFRDPFVVRDGDGWLMIVGAGLPGGGGAVLAYRSDDLERFRYAGVLLSGGGDGYGDAWECPQLLDFGDRRVLVFAIWSERVGYDVRYAVGVMAGDRFDVASRGVLSYGPGPYAPTTFRDAAGRACVMFWLRDIAGDGWAGAHSIPYLLDLDGDVLVATPHPDLCRYAGPAADGVVPGAGIVAWSARDGQTLRVGDAAQLTCEAELIVRIGPDEWRMPRGDDVQVVVDATVLEVSSTSGVFAAAVAPQESLTISGDGSVVVRALVRPSGTPAAPR